MLSLSRVLRPDSPDWPYRGYHSSNDTPGITSNARLAESRDLVLRMIDALESNVVPVNNYKGEVFCSRFGVHIDFYTNPEGNKALFDILFLIDGTRSIARIASECGISFEAAQATIEELQRRGVVRLEAPGANVEPARKATRGPSEHRSAARRQPA
jgi:aminopeptidase-like protein